MDALRLFGRSCRTFSLTWDFYGRGRVLVQRALTISDGESVIWKVDKDDVGHKRTPICGEWFVIGC